MLYTLWNQENNFFLIENLKKEVTGGADKKSFKYKN